jgi:ABC-2 type transport system permease protein
MNAFGHHLTYEFRTGLRDRSMLLMNYLFPIFFFVMMGLLMTQVNPTFTQTMTPAMILVAIMSGTLLGLPNPLLTSRESGIFRSFKINGIPSFSIISIPALTSVLHMALISATITAAGPIFFHAAQPTNWIWFVVVWFASVFACAGLGMLIGVVAPNSRATVLLAQLIFLPSMMLGGLMMPTSVLPASLAKVAQLLPTTHAMAAFNGLAMGQQVGHDPIFNLIILIAAGLISFSLAVYLFHWDNTTKRSRNPWLALIALLPYIASFAIR